MVVYLSEDLLRRYYQAHNLPYGHLKVHLRELEQALEEARHFDLISPRRGRGRTKVGWPAGRPWKRNVRIHRVWVVSSMRLQVAVSPVRLE
jgi:hypothetical protein